MFRLKVLLGLIYCLNMRVGISFGESPVIFPNLPIAIRKTDNAVCKQQSDLYLENVHNLTLWAHEMWDSTAKTTSGILRAAQMHFGNFDQCLSVKAPFPTKYCLAKIVANLPQPQRGLPHYRPDPFSLDYSPYESVLSRIYPYDTLTQQPRNLVQMGWCVPASCTILDLQTYLNEYLSKSENLPAANLTYSAEFSDLFCQTANELNKFDTADISFCILALTLFLLVVLATCFNIKSSEENWGKRSKTHQVFLAFSAKSGYKSLSKKVDTDGPLGILYGMRTLCILAIVCGHRMATFTATAVMNFDYVEEQYRSLSGSVVFRTDLVVDAFFFLSGLLAAYGLLKQFNRKFIHPAIIILTRYIRLTPVYAFVIFYYATILTLFSNGPLWKPMVVQDSLDCKNNWWASLLYLGTYINPDNMCIPISWYLPCDFHYFIIAIFVCLLLGKREKIGFLLLGLLLIVSVLIPFALTLIYERPGLMHFYPELLTNPKVHPDWKLTYTKSHTRASPYLVGMLIGYYYYKWEKGSGPKHISRLRSYAVLAVSIFLLALIFLSGAVFYNPYHEYNALEAASYAGLHRVVFAIGTAGIVLVSSYGHASGLRKLLNWGPFVPLSKLTYGVYLTHFQFQLTSAAKTRSPTHFSYFDLYYSALGDIFLSFLVAFVLYIGIEQPFTNIFRILMFRTRTTATDDKSKPMTNKNDVQIVMSNSDLGQSTSTSIQNLESKL